jgi:hypothetical protein
MEKIKEFVKAHKKQLLIVVAVVLVFLIYKKVKK